MLTDDKKQIRVYVTCDRVQECECVGECERDCGWLFGFVSAGLEGAE
jgi:hypothetical protein